MFATLVMQRPFQLRKQEATNRNDGKAHKVQVKILRNSKEATSNLNHARNPSDAGQRPNSPRKQEKSSVTEDTGHWIRVKTPAIPRKPLPT